MRKRKVIFRVDGNGKIGLGHISRSCALADMLRDDFEVYFYTRATSETILEDIKKYCVSVFILNDAISYEEEAVQWIKALKGDEIVVLDGYDFITYYQQQIKDKGSRLVCIDDIHACHFVADALINHAPGIDEKKYSVEPYTQLYLGTDYVLLKKIFLDEAAKRDKVINVEQSPILICLGGADPNNFTKQVLSETIRLFPYKKVNVVVGAGFAYFNDLNEIVRSNQNVTVYRGVQPEDMLTLMRQSNIAVTSASTIALEYICVKGNVFLKCIADNQKEMYKSLIEKGCAYPCESLKQHNYTDSILDNQSKLVDGKSNRRLLKIFNGLS